MDPKNLHYKFFLASFVLHVILLIVFVWVNASSDLKKQFIVFGAYSKKPTKVFFGTPRGKKFGHGTKRKGTVECKKSQRTKNNASKHEQKGKGSHGAKQAKVVQKQNGKKGKLSDHAMRAASKLGKHDQKRHIKGSNLSSLPEAKAKTEIKNKRQARERKKNKRQEKELAKKEQSRKERERKQEEVLRKKEEEQRAKEEQKRLEEEIERKQAEEQAALELEKELEQQKVVEQTKLAAAAQQDKDDEDQEAGDADGDDEGDDDDDDDDDALSFNLIGPGHADWTIYQKDIQKEVTRLWRPPLGVPRGTVCKIRFRVDHEGKVESFVLAERSKMLIYDLSIVRVAKNFKFDKPLWGKEFDIGFKQ